MSVWPFRNVGLKALSVLLAILLWMTVAGEQTVERVLRVPLELQQFPTELELVGDFPTAIDVRVRGSAGALSRVAAGDVVAVLDLNGAEAGPRLFRLTPEEVRAPFGIEVVQVNPTTVPMTFVNPALRHAPAVGGASGQAVERTLRDRPLELRNLPANLTASASPGQIDITLAGAREALVRIEPNEVTPYVDLAGLSAGQYALTVRADIGREVGLRRITPSTVQVRISDVK